MTMVTKKKTGVDAELEKAISKLLKEIMKDEESTLDAKLKVIDRSIKLEALKAKMDDSNFGLGFMSDEE